MNDKVLGQQWEIQTSFKEKEKEEGSTSQVLTAVQRIVRRGQYRAFSALSLVLELDTQKADVPKDCLSLQAGYNKDHPQSLLLCPFLSKVISIW